MKADAERHRRIGYRLSCPEILIRYNRYHCRGSRTKAWLTHIFDRLVAYCNATGTQNRSAGQTESDPEGNRRIRCRLSLR